MSLTSQRWYPLCGALVSGGLAYAFLRDVPEGTASTLMGHAINVAAISVGFIATAKSILASIEQTRIIELMRESGYYDDLLDHMVNAIKLWFWVAFLSGALVLIGELPDRWGRGAFSFWIFSIAWAALAGYRVLSMLTLVLRQVGKARRSSSAG